MFLPLQNIQYRKTIWCFFSPIEKATHAPCYITLLTRLRVAHSHLIHYGCRRPRRKAMQADTQWI